jgi:hypothetical protein
MPRAKKKFVRKLWTNADVKMLKALAGRKNTEAIARRLKRTFYATRQKAMQLGISLAVR